MTQPIFTSREVACVVCGTTFTATHPRSITCGPECRETRYRQKLQEFNDRQKQAALKKRQDKECATCHVKFQAHHNTVKYCSEECRRKGLEFAMARQKHRREQQVLANREAREERRRAKQLAKMGSRSRRGMREKETTEGVE